MSEPGIENEQKKPVLSESLPFGFGLKLVTVLSLSDSDKTGCSVPLQYKYTSRSVKIKAYFLQNLSLLVNSAEFERI